jgi:Tfp pilus assembly protein PilN
MNKIQPIITLVAILLAVLLFTGVLNPYKKKYLQELEMQRQASQARIDSLQVEIEIIEERNKKLEERADSIYKVLGTSESKRKKERDEHKKKLAELGQLSTAELPSYFTKRYNR